MNRPLLFCGTALVFVSTLVVAQEAPESLLPPGFDNAPPAQPPAPEPSSRPQPQPSPQQPPSTGQGSGTTNNSGNIPGSVSNPVVQQLPGRTGSNSGGRASGQGGSRSSGSTGRSLGSLPSISELENLGEDQLDELLGLKPRFDMPQQARRSMDAVGVLSQAEGGLPQFSLARQPTSLVQATLSGLDGPLVSRWGHILLRRALASRMAAPEGMEPADFVAMRVAALNKMGEHRVARSVVQDVDTDNWNEALTDAGLDAYLGSMDIVGACPVIKLSGAARDDAQSKMLQDICYAYSGQSNQSRGNIRRAIRKGDLPEIDLRLTQRYAGAAGAGGRAVNIEWEDVDELTPWRFSLALSLGLELPDKFSDKLGPYYRRAIATAPMVPTGQRASYADLAASEGILSSETMVDLYSELHTSRQGVDRALLTRASQLRDAYVADEPAARLQAIKKVWGGGDAQPVYGRLVLTAYAAARLEPSEDFAAEAENLVASMLSAGLDRNALRWAEVVGQGSTAWGQLALAAPQRENPVSEGQFDQFWGDDESAGQMRSKFLLAGLVGLDRIDADDASDIAEELGIDFSRQTKWSSLIDQAADVQNPALVSYLAGLGMQGTSWDKMTPRHLYYIVSALNRVGLSAEARMIAAEAVARG